MKFSKDYYEVRYCKCGKPLVTMREVTDGICEDCKIKKGGK